MNNRSIKQRETELVYAAEDFKKVSERSGSRAKIDQVDNEVISLQIRLGAFKHACRIELRSENGYFISGQKSFSQISKSTTASSSSRNRNAKADLEKKSQKLVSQKADKIEEQTTQLKANTKMKQTRLKAEIHIKQAERLAAEHAKQDEQVQV